MKTPFAVPNLIGILRNATQKKPFFRDIFNLIFIGKEN